MLTFDSPETFAIITRTKTGLDGDGNDVYTPTEVPTCGAYADEGTSELIQGQETVLTHPTVYLEFGAPIPTPKDQMRVRGEVYDVDGKPQLFHNPFTSEEPGAVVKLLKVTG